MIRINLLPFRAARKKENIRRQISIFVLMLFLVAIILGYGYYLLNSRVKGLQKQVADTKIEVAKYKKITAEIEAIKKKLAILRQKRAVIEKLQTNRFEPVNLLDTMSLKIVEKRMWFTKFQAKGNNINIDGLAVDNTTIADFMVNLEGSGIFKQVKLKTIMSQGQKKGSGKSYKAFSLSCVKGTPPSTKKPKKATKK